LIFSVFTPRDIVDIAVAVSQSSRGLSMEHKKGQFRKYAK
jgi:hypothetical protein